MERPDDHTAVAPARRAAGAAAGLLHPFICRTADYGGRSYYGIWIHVRHCRRVRQRVRSPVSPREVIVRRPADPEILRGDYPIARFPDYPMLAKRLIACLDVRNGCVVKGVQFEDLAVAGDPGELATRYDAEGIDELVVLDVTATIEKRRALEHTLRKVSAQLFIP